MVSYVGADSIKRNQQIDVLFQVTEKELLKFLDS